MADGLVTKPGGPSGKDLSVGAPAGVVVVVVVVGGGGGGGSGGGGLGLVVAAG